MDPQDLYGLKPEFLEGLNIIPPLRHWIRVSKFRCEEFELREVLGLAGRVVIFLVSTLGHKSAKVKYSHPLEAVQAVSMLNGQIFYGNVLRVEMDVDNNQLLLPKGLASIGPGLGQDGEAADILTQYERLLHDKPCSMNLSLFDSRNINEIILSQKRMHVVYKREPAESSGCSRDISPHHQMQSLPTSTPATSANHNSAQAMPTNIRPGVTPQAYYRGVHMNSNNNMSMPSSLPPHVVSMRPTQIRFASSQPQATPTKSVPRPHQNSKIQTYWQYSSQRPQPIMYRGANPNTLIINNLPPTTTFPSLCDKLSTWAHITSLEFTTPGCAIVVFLTPAGAERCLRNYRGLEFL